jgi:glycosyltransferase involved in cell wall biosynthesis
MKILQVVTQMEAGGAQRVASLLHDGFIDLGYHSELCFLYTKRPTFPLTEEVSSLFERVPNGSDYLRIFSKLCCKLKAFQPDVLITHTHYANVMGQVAAALCGTRKRIAVQHNPLPSYPRIARWSDRILGSVGVYSRIVAVSDAVVQTVADYPDRYRRLVTQIYNGLPPAPAREHEPDVRRSLRLPDGAPLLVNVARLSQQKNQSVLLRALQKISGVHLAIVGDGELRQKLSEEAHDLRVAERVHFIGEVPRDKVFSYLHAADAFVFPSIFESMGLAVVEAMQAGVPVIASDLPALREVLGEAGEFCNPIDADAWARAMRNSICSPTTAEVRVLLGRQRAQRFSLQGMMQGYEQCILGERDLDAQKVETSSVAI